MTDCLFCKIVHKEIPAYIVHEDDETVAFLDIHPRAPGHTMVISKTHSETFLDLPKDRVGPLFLGVQKVVSQIARALQPDGFTYGANHGKVSGQEVEHLHIHVIPRFTGDGGGSIQSVVNNPPRETIEEISRRIKNE